MNDFDIARQIPLIADSGAASGRNCPEQAELVAYLEALLGAEKRTKLILRTAASVLARSDSWFAR